MNRESANQLSPALAETEVPRSAFSRQLAFAFAAVAALTVALAAMMISSAWNYQFDQYVRDNLQRVADGVSQIAGQAYDEYGGWTLPGLSTIPRFGPMRGYAIQVVDAQGTLIYDDSSTSSTGPVTDDGSGDTQFVIQPRGQVVTSAIVLHGVRIGTVRVWAYGAGAVLTDRDEQFRRASFVALTIAALVAIAFASIGGAWYARRLVRPIETITAAARALRGGDRDARTRLDGDDEFAVLGRTFDEMADSIEADRQLERRLTADVAHELRTPLQAIQATVEAMQDGVLPADEERLGVVRDETVRLARLADGILELTRLEGGSLPFDSKPLDIAMPVSAAVDALEALVESRDLTMSVDLTEGLRVHGDSDRLQQAVSNLLANAARYTAPGGRVTVSVRAQGDQAVIEVADTGAGIAAEDIDHVFDRFWRADSARATATGGIGIGLAVTKEIVERHQGSIGVESVEGSGARFFIRLPLMGSQAPG